MADPEASGRGEPPVMLFFRLTAFEYFVSVTI